MNNKDYKIRKAGPDDVLGLHNIYLTTWLNTYPNKEFNITVQDIKYRYKSRLTPKKIEERKIKLSQVVKNKLMLVVEKDSKLVASCHAVQKKDYNQLQAIYVLPEYQRLGIGLRLWQEVQKIFDIKKDIIVHVASYNSNAIEFYKKLGFISTGKIFYDEKHKMRNGAIIPELEMVIKR